MNYQEFKEKIFAERPDVKVEYDKLGPEYEIKRTQIQQELNRSNINSKESS